MHELTDENVRNLFQSCLMTADEIDAIGGATETEDHITEGVYIKAALHKERLAQARELVFDMLLQLPTQFLATGGGGWLFQNACARADAVQWTDHQATMDELIAMGIALKVVELSRMLKDVVYVHVADHRMRPLHKHDCDDCVFLGHYPTRRPGCDPERERLDYYHCPNEAFSKNGMGGSLISRYASTGHSYSSMPVKVLAEWPTIEEEAVARQERNGGHDCWSPRIVIPGSWMQVGQILIRKHKLWPKEHTEPDLLRMPHVLKTTDIGQLPLGGFPSMQHVQKTIEESMEQ